MIEPFNTSFNSKKHTRLVNLISDASEDLVTLDVHNIDNNKDNKIAQIEIYDELTETSETFDLNVRQCIFLGRMLLHRANEIVPGSVPMCITLEHMIHDDNTPFAALLERQNH